MDPDIGPVSGEPALTRRMIRVGCVLALVFAAAMIGAGTWAAHHWPYRQDRHLFEYMGQRILDGGTLYRDCWDNKPPLVPWINAGVLAISDRSTVAVTVADGLAAATASAVLGLGVRAWFGSGVACLVTLLSAGMFSLRYYDGCTDGTELYGAMFDSVAATFVLVAWRTPDRRRLPAVTVAGLAFAAAFVCKQNQLAGPLAVGATLIVRAVADRKNRLLALSQFVAFSLGMAGGVGLVAWVLYQQGVLPEAGFAVFASNRSFIDRGIAWLVPGRAVLGLLVQQAAPLTLPIWLAAVGVLATFAGARVEVPAFAHRPMTLPRWVIGMLVAWLALAAYSVMWGPCHLTRYWHVCFIPLLWLSAQACAFFREAFIQASPSARTILVAVACTTVWYTAAPALRRQQNDLLSAYHYATADSELARIREVARAVRQRTSEGELIYVWGYEPGIYRFSHRAAPGRFADLCKVPLLGGSARFMVNEVLGDLANRQPRLILLQRSDEKAVQSGQWEGTDVSALRDLLERAYRRSTEVCGYVFYERVATATSPEKP